MKSRQDHTDKYDFHRAMGLRRWFLILAAPVVLLLTLISVEMWWGWLRWLLR